MSIRRTADDRHDRDDRAGRCSLLAPVVLALLLACGIGPAAGAFAATSASTVVEEGAPVEAEVFQQRRSRHGTGDRPSTASVGPAASCSSPSSRRLGAARGDTGSRPRGPAAARTSRHRAALTERAASHV